MTMALNGRRPPLAGVLVEDKHLAERQSGGARFVSSSPPVFGDVKEFPGLNRRMADRTAGVKRALIPWDLIRAVDRNQRLRLCLQPPARPEDGRRCDFERDAESFHGRTLERVKGSIWELEGRAWEVAGALGNDLERLRMLLAVWGTLAYSATFCKLGWPRLSWRVIRLLPGG
ncbi:hypothetical protein MA16_Dca023545 [Dendrobium catenatum]|uniref:Uncharacterized protein n=1 Tax=Dendrobium catenatum TaxID=906689 RepID=A0A2I0VHU8_9ASPA|nr:hypothetical protein MA16_Dca023545 [Dendrobium catenatum]